MQWLHLHALLIINVVLRPYQYGKKVCATLHDSWNSIGLYKVNVPVSSILMKPRDMNSLTLLDALRPMAYTLHGIKYT